MTDFTIVVLPGTFAASVAATLDILRAASVLAPRLKMASPTWRVLSASGGAVPLSAGMHLETKALPKRHHLDMATWIVPGLGIDDADALAAGLAREDARRVIQAVAAHAARGGRVAASCSAVFLLQAAGLLSGRRVTTSWWLATELRKLEPSCIVDSDRMVCTDGLLNTAGAAFAQTDLMLHLLRVQFGVALADAVGRVLLIDGRQAQTPFMVPAMLSNGNELITRLVMRIESALPNPPSVETLAREFAMSQRTLSRRVREATGKSTMALVHCVRMNRARMLIESSKMTIEAVAEQVGYEGATALRRLMRKVAGANPSHYRASGLTS
ncbi:MAG: helix-turn-helix domain-containing protein [Polaromonas sp.]|uniref:GlxA family transcriptional regulator n=1 Tax=Polaromonas sp. TaxID=1869339 RepID=UPI00248825E9|nr:helix-turn-helix domain-containing protein [Polaromonas sp.]MDI1269396.1 helix-turn-helix domain-containing protein [Polaromonas sp.]